MDVWAAVVVAAAVPAAVAVAAMAHLLAFRQLALEVWIVGSHLGGLFGGRRMQPGQVRAVAGFRSRKRSAVRHVQWLPLVLLLL